MGGEQDDLAKEVLIESQQEETTQRPGTNKIHAPATTHPQSNHSKWIEKNTPDIINRSTILFSPVVPPNKPERIYTPVCCRQRTETCQYDVKHSLGRYRWMNFTDHRKSRCSISGDRDPKNWVKQWQCNSWGKKHNFFSCMCWSIFNICRELSLAGWAAAVHTSDLCGTFLKVQCYSNRECNCKHTKSLGYCCPFVGR